MLQSMGSQRVEHNWAAEQQPFTQIILISVWLCSIFYPYYIQCSLLFSIFFHFWKNGDLGPLNCFNVSLVDSEKYSVQLLSHVRLFATPWITARQSSLSFTNSRSSLRLANKCTGENELSVLKNTKLYPHFTLYFEPDSREIVTKCEQYFLSKHRDTMKIFLSCQRTNDKGKYWLVWQPQFKNSLLLGKSAELVSRILNEFLKINKKNLIK